MRTDLNNLKVPVKFPSRVILNMDTISVYETEETSSFYSGFKLKDITVLGKDKKDPDHCFIVGTLDRQITMCGMVYSRLDIKKDIEQWIKDIKMFRDDCKPVVQKPDDILKDPSVLAAINTAKQQKMLLKLKNNLANESKKEEPEDLKIKKAQLIAWRTLEKEKKFEERKLKEEELKERVEQETVKKQMECENNKKDKILNAIILKKKAKNIRKKIETQKEIELIKREMQQRILKNRKMLEERLFRMKKAHERILNMSRQKINEMHASLATNLISAEKKGDMKKCDPKTPDNTRNQYCNENFNDSTLFYMMKDCLDRNQYCDVCCEHEYGEMYLDKKEICKGQCDMKLELTQQGGKWVWVENKNTNGNITEQAGMTQKVMMNNDLPFKNR